jgi:hypothetical protein
MASYTNVFFSCGMFVGGVASGVVLGFIYLGCGGFGFSSIAVSPSFLPSFLPLTNTLGKEEDL